MANNFWTGDMTMFATSRLRFRILFPSIALVLAFILSELGDAQYERLLRLARGHGGPHEVLPDANAMAYYLGYALNVPAWWVKINLHRVFPPWTRWGEVMYQPSWWYMLFIVLLWFYLGTLADRWRDSRRVPDSFSRTWGHRLVGLVWIVAGYLICSTGLQLRDNYLYAPWFTAVVIVWGLAVVGGGLYVALGRPRHLTAPSREFRSGGHSTL